MLPRQCRPLIYNMQHIAHKIPRTADRAFYGQGGRSLITASADHGSAQPTRTDYDAPDAPGLSVSAVRWQVRRHPAHRDRPRTMEQPYRPLHSLEINDSSRKKYRRRLQAGFEPSMGGDDGCVRAITAGARDA